MYNNFIWSV